VEAFIIRLINGNEAVQEGREVNAIVFRKRVKLKKGVHNDTRYMVLTYVWLLFVLQHMVFSVKKNLAKKLSDSISATILYSYFYKHYLIICVNFYDFRNF
jgi:hypothetical protein